MTTLNHVTMLLVLAVLLGLAAFGSVETIRAIEPIRSWARAGKRPWGCDLCMSFWTGFAWMTGAVVSEIVDRSFLTFVTAFATVGACLVALTLRGPSLPPPLPTSEEG